MSRAAAAPLEASAPTGRLSSVTSALLVLKVFSEDEAEIGISNLAKRLGLAKSTVHRLAVTLAAEGFLEQNPDNGRYRLGLSLFSLGASVAPLIGGVIADRWGLSATFYFLAGTIVCANLFIALMPRGKPALA